jgi:malic enzyme
LNVSLAEGFVYKDVFRGALDAKATQIKLPMKLATARQLAELAPANTLLPDMLDKQVRRLVANAAAVAWPSQKNTSLLVKIPPRITTYKLHKAMPVCICQNRHTKFCH